MRSRSERKCMSQSAPLCQSEQDVHCNGRIEVEEGKRRAREQMRENTHPQLFLIERKPRICPEDKRCDQAPGPPVSERTKQSTAPIAGRKVRQGKQHPKSAPQQDRRDPG